MDPAEIKALAEKGYNAIKDHYNFNGNVIVSALFIPSLGIAVGSKPCGMGVANELLEKSHRISNKPAPVSKWFQRYWELIETRDSADCKSTENSCRGYDNHQGCRQVSAPTVHERVGQ